MAHFHSSISGTSTIYFASILSKIVQGLTSQNTYNLIKLTNIQNIAYGSIAMLTTT